MTNGTEKRSNEKQDAKVDAIRHHERLDQIAATCRTAAIESANVAIRSMLLINGGAVVALLAFIGAIQNGNPSAINSAGLVEPIWWFAVGVGCAAVVAALAYTVNMLDSDISGGFKYSYQYPYAEDSPTNKRLRSPRQFIHYLALALAVGSLGSFFVGVWSITDVLKGLTI